MAVTLDVDVGRGGITLDASAAELMAAFGLDEKALQRAQVRALNKTVRWIYGKFARHLQSELRSTEGLQLTQKILKDRMRQALAKGSKLQARLWMGLYNLPLIKFGKGRRSGAGYRVKSRFVGGGFRATMRSGHEGVFYRLGKGRLPIQEATVKVRAASSTVLSRLLPLAEQELDKKMQQELNYELHKKQGTA